MAERAAAMWSALPIHRQAVPRSGNGAEWTLQAARRVVDGAEIAGSAEGFTAAHGVVECAPGGEIPASLNSSRSSSMYRASAPARHEVVALLHQIAAIDLLGVDDLCRAVARSTQLSDQLK